MESENKNVKSFEGITEVEATLCVDGIMGQFSVADIAQLEDEMAKEALIDEEELVYIDPAKQNQQYKLVDSRKGTSKNLSIASRRRLVMANVWRPQDNQRRR